MGFMTRLMGNKRNGFWLSPLCYFVPFVVKNHEPSLCSSVPSVVKKSASCPLWLMPFEDSGEEAITRMNAGNRAQKVAANQIVYVLPDQFAGLLQPL